MKTIIEIGHGNTLEIEDCNPQGGRESTLVTVVLKDAKGNRFGDGVAKMEDFKRLGKVMK